MRLPLAPGGGRRTWREIRRELEDWRWKGRRTTVEEWSGVPIYRNEFWTSRQRAAHSLHEISYRACFKPQLPGFFIHRLTDPGDVVFDPFMGRGTTLLEASLNGRHVLGNDINPLSRVLLEARLCPPTLAEVEARLRSVPLDDPVECPGDFEVFFERRTLHQICGLRKYLSARRTDGRMDRVDRWIQMVAVNRLTGHSPGFFSVYTLPPNQAASLESQRRNNERRDQTPEYRDVVSLILRKTRSLLRDAAFLSPTGESRGWFRQPANRPYAYSGPPAALSVTSPPFMDIVNYKADNWLRCWFIGFDAEDIAVTQTRRLEEWKNLVRGTLESAGAVSAAGAAFAFEVGEIRSGSLLLDRAVVQASRETPWEPLCVLVNEQSFTKTSNTWGVRNNRGGTNSNRIVLMRRR